MVPLGRLVLPRFSLQLEFLHQRFCDREKKQRKFVGYLVVVVRACVRTRESWEYGNTMLRSSSLGRQEEEGEGGAWIATPI